jgi:hypothetical protein
VSNDLIACAKVFADPVVVIDLICKTSCCIALNDSSFIADFYPSIDNAVQYGEKICLSSLLSRDPEMILRLSARMTGQGSLLKREKIFERGLGKSTGLGLAHSREILDITGITMCETGDLGKEA